MMTAAQIPANTQGCFSDCDLNLLQIYFFGLPDLETISPSTQMTEFFNA